MANDFIGLTGLCALVLFGFAVWPPLSLLVMGLAFLAISWANR